MQLGLGLLESLGLHRSLLLEVGLFRTQLGVELLQRLRPLGEFDRFVRGLFPKGAFARLDLEESLFGLLRSAFGARMHLGRGPPRFLGGLLAALEVLVASSDPVDVGPELFFIFFAVDFARLNRARSSSSSLARFARSAFRASRSLRTLSAFAASISRDSSRPASSPKRLAFSSAWVRLASSFSWRDCSRASSSISRDRIA